MSCGQPSLVHLRRIDPAHGLWRFYSLALQPNLLGGVDLIRRWGRIGTQGGAVLVETYPDAASAQAALERLAAAKRRRGYAERLGPCGPSTPTNRTCPDERVDPSGAPRPGGNALPLLTLLAGGATPVLWRG